MKRNEATFLVYGTLKAAHGNHRRLGKNPEFLGHFETEPKYTMYGKNAGFPIVERGGNTSIKGEIYRVTNPDDVASVFALEGCSSQEQNHPSNWYDFDEITLPNGIKGIMFVMDKGEARSNDIEETGKWR